MARNPTLFPMPSGFKSAKAGGPRKGILGPSGPPVQIVTNSIIVPIDVADLSNRVIGNALKAGVTKACHAIMDDAMNEAPKVPKRGGTLRESGAIFINNELIHENAKEGGRWASAAEASAGATMATGGASPYQREGGIHKKQVSGMVAFLMWYAGLVHEGVAGWYTAKKWTLAGSGRKFLSTKLDRHTGKYVQLIRDEVQEGLAKSVKRMKSRAGISRRK